MKTVKQAVKHFNSVWPYSDNYPFMMQGAQGYYKSGVGVAGEFEVLVCTRAEFDKCVGEL